MSKLLKADFFRMLKSKLTYILFGIAVGMPLLTCILYVGLNKLVGLFDEEGQLISIINGKGLFFTGYSTSNNIGIIIPIFASIIVCMDISNGTLRNKIICGCSRFKIYLSHLLSTIIYSVIMISIYVGFTAIFSSLFFGYGTELNVEEVKNIIVYVASGTLMYAFIASIITFLALVTKNAAPTIIFTLLITIFLGLILSILSILDMAKYADLLFMIPTYLHNAISFDYTAVSTGHLIEGFISYVVFTVGISAAGIAIFNKKDVK